MDKALQRQIKRNLRGFVVLKVFAKRVFLPISAIYYVEVSGLSLQDIGLLATWYAAIAFIAEVPTGYFADKFGRTRGIRIGAIGNIIAMGCYIFWQNKTGVFVGIIFETLGYSFYNGAGEALVHDSLAVTGKEREYSKFVGRSQSMSLIVNAILMALVPLTYSIDKRLPFVAGVGAYLVLFITSFVMADVHKSSSIARPRRPSFAKVFEKRHLLFFAVLFGFIGATYFGIIDFYNLALKEFGLRPELLGWVFAAGSAFGVIVGIWVHLLRKLPAWMYAALDCAFAILPMVAASTGSVSLLAGTLVLHISFFRYRRIIYQDHLLTIYPTRYKATLLSAMNNVDNLNMLWVPIAISFVVSQQGLAGGLGICAIVLTAVTPVYLLSVRRHFKHS